mgnify:FL=1
MVTVSGITSTKLLALLFTLTVVLAGWMASPRDSLARQKRPTVSNKCGCFCKDRAGLGEFLTGIQNTAGVPCEAYDNRTCSLMAVREQGRP